MNRVGFFYDDVYLTHENPPGHPERADRLRAILRYLKEGGTWDQLVHIAPRKASFEQLLAVHTPEHVERMKSFTGYADPDTYVSPGSLEAALFAAGAVLEAIDQVKAGDIKYAFCAVRPPGHHAEADRAMGFCLFNNVAVGARYAQQQGFKKVFIADFDVHHGNGTQHIFESDPSVFYFSTHQSPHYPGTGGSRETGKGAGEGTTANYPMPPGSGHKEYFEVYHNILPGLIQRFDPDIILVSAGYDIHASDPLANISIQDEGIRAIVGGILSGKDVPVIFALEGGYNLDGLGRSVLVTLQELLSFKS